jgi:hypothetical protein
MFISVFQNETDNEPQSVEVIWPELAQQLSDFVFTSCGASCVGKKCRDKSGAAWSPVEYAEGASRGKANVLNVYALVLDFDDLTDEQIGAVEAALAPYEHVIHSSHSHNPDAGRVRLRAVLPLAKPVAGRQWTRTWERAVAALGLTDIADTSCSDASRLFFCPSAPEGTEPLYHHNPGEMFDAAAHADVPAVVRSRADEPRPAIAEEQVVDLNDITEALRAVSNPRSKELVRSILRGDPLPEGAHDDSLNRFAGVCARAVPLHTPVAAIIEVLKPTLHATPCDESTQHHIDEFVDMLERARKRRVEDETKERNVAEAARQLVAKRRRQPEPQSDDDEDEPAAAPEPVLAYVAPWDKYVYRTGARWRSDRPLSKTAATAYLKTSGAITRALEQFDRETAIGEAIVETRSLPVHPLCVITYGVDCIPGNADLVTVDANGEMVINTWAPPTVEARAGEWPNLRRVIDYLTSSSDGVPDPEGAEWLIHWMAAKVQNPAFTLLTSPVIHGPPGGGKNTIARALMEALGVENCAIIGQESLESDFNAHYATKLFVFADECIPARGIRDLSGKLKAAITGEWLTLNAKGVQQTRVRNRLAWMFASNSDNPISIEPDDRRYSVFSNRVPITDEYRDFLRAFWHPTHANEPSDWFWEEIAAFRHDLETMEFDRMLVRTPHRNEARSQVIEANLSSTDAFAREVEQVGFTNLLELLGGGAVCPMSRQRDKSAPTGYTAHCVFLLYKAWCESRGYRAHTANMLGRRLTAAGWIKRAVPGKVYWPPERATTVQPLTAAEKVAAANVPDHA